MAKITVEIICTDNTCAGCRYVQMQEGGDYHCVIYNKVFDDLNLNRLSECLAAEVKED